MVDPSIIVAGVSLVGTVIGTFSGIVVSSRLTNYRLEQLEKKVDEHNGFGRKIPVIEERLKVINHRLDDLENPQNIT